MLKGMVVFIVLLSYGYAHDNYYYKNNHKTGLRLASRQHPHINYYRNTKGYVFGVTNTLIIKLKDAHYLPALLDAFELSLEKALGNDLYLLKTSNKDLTIDTANRLHEMPYIEYAHPDFIKHNTRR